MESTLIEALSGPRTDKGALTLSTSNSPLIDFFFLLGALRGAESIQITQSWKAAFDDNQRAAIKLLFYARDRNGQGERELFRTIVRFLAKGNEIQRSVIQNNLQNIPYYGRWDDLFCLLDTPLEREALELYSNALKAGDALAAKWAPREKSSKRNIAIKLMSIMSLTPKQYRKLLSSTTKVVETQMCLNKWDEIDYSTVPSIAMSNYRKTFEKHSKERWDEYVEALASGKAKVNTSVLYPYQIISPLLEGQYAYETFIGEESNQLDFLNQQWKSLPDYIAGNREKILPVVDVSGSMFRGKSKRGPQPIDISISLGMYIAERSQGIFKDAFMTFSSEPQLVHLQSNTLIERVMEMKRASWGMSTDLVETFRVLLNTAMTNHISPDQMPSVLLVISDMEFDHATKDHYGEELTNYQTIKNYYQSAGYDLPKIVFWNVNGKPGNVPVSTRDNNTLLVSGFSPVIMKYILASGSVKPMDLVNYVVDNVRYQQVVV